MAFLNIGLQLYVSSDFVCRNSNNIHLDWLKYHAKNNQSIYESSEASF